MPVKVKNFGIIKSIFPFLFFFCVDLVALSQIPNILILETLNVFFLDELVDGFLNVGDFRGKTGTNLLDGFLHELDMFHFLAGFHDSDDGGLFEW